MANKTSIEWTDYNWNFLRGCSRVSEGCRNCYAEGVAARFSGEGQPYEGLAKFVDHKPRWTGEIGFFEDVLLQPLRWTKPRKVFVNSMSDLFHEKVTDEWLDKAFAVMALTPQHTYQILTKRPARMLEYLRDLESRHTPDGNMSISPQTELTSIALENGFFPKDTLTAINLLTLEWPLPNVWLGVSVEDQKTADERIPLLLQTPAAVRWISAEPLLEDIDLEHRPTGFDVVWFNYLTGRGHIQDGREVVDQGVPIQDNKLDWAVVGGESGPNARPCDIAWIRSIVEQCGSANVPVFVKQLGSHPRREGMLPDLYISDRKGGTIEDFPEDLRIREMPEVKNG